MIYHGLQLLVLSLELKLFIWYGGTFLTLPAFFPSEGEVYALSRDTLSSMKRLWWKAARWALGFGDALSASDHEVWSTCILVPACPVNHLIFLFIQVQVRLIELSVKFLNLCFGHSKICLALLELGLRDRLTRRRLPRVTDRALDHRSKLGIVRIILRLSLQLIALYLQLVPFHRDFAYFLIVSLPNFNTLILFPA